MPDIDLDAIEARANAATDGPWGYPSAGKNRITTPVDIDITEADWGGENLREYVLSCLDDRNAWRAADAEFIAHARTDVPALVAEVRRLTALVNAKQSWIDGAKVDMAAMEEERAKALAAIALAGEEIERASVEVKRSDRQRDDARAAIAAVRAPGDGTYHPIADALAKVRDLLDQALDGA